MRQFSSEFCSQNRMLVLGETADTISVGILESGDGIARERLENSLRARCPSKKVVYTRLSGPDLMMAVSALEGGPETKKGKGGAGKEKTGNGYEISAIESGAPVITVVNSILLDAKNRGASDIHLERKKGLTLVRMRVDGALRTSRRFDESLGRALSVRIKLMANLNTLETRKPQDGRISVTDGTVEHDVRVSVVPSVDGESIVLRFLDTAERRISLASLGFSPEVLAMLQKIPSRPDGLVLVTGPTGSGKTTTLAALVSLCDPDGRKIISVEDPVEYRIPGLTQIQTNDNIGLGFGILLRRILRQDPDVLMIGEIRDEETAELAVRAALTGHLVFATLHTRTAREAETRLADMGVPEYLLKTVLHAAVGQRLVRKKCLRCGGSGCEGCSRSGFSGRVPVAEVYFPRERADGKGNGRERTMADEGRCLVESGVTTRGELERVLGELS